MSDHYATGVVAVRQETYARLVALRDDYVARMEEATGLAPSNLTLGDVVDALIRRHDLVPTPPPAATAGDPAPRIEEEGAPSRLTPQLGIVS